MGRRRRERVVLGQQARCLDGTGMGPGQARSLQPQTQGLCASGRAATHFIESLQCGSGITVVERPARGSQLHRLTHFHCCCLTAVLQRGTAMNIARRAVLQRMCRFGGQQMRHGAQACHETGTVVVRLERAHLRQHRLSGLARTHKSPRRQVCKCVEQRRLHGAFAVALTPLARRTRHGEQGGQRAQGRIQCEKRQHHQHQHQVERQIDPIRWPEQRHRPRIAAGKQGRRHRDGKQRQQPQGNMHADR